MDIGVTKTVESFVVAASTVLELVGGHFDLGTNVSETLRLLKVTTLTVLKQVL